MAVLCCDAFGMKLNAVDIIFFMPQTHQQTILGPGARFELVGQARRIDHKRMIARCFKILFEAFKDALIVMRNRADLAMHGPRCRNDESAKSLSDRLMPQTNAEHRNISGCLPNELKADASFVGIAGAGRKYDRSSTERARLVNVERVVAPDIARRAELAEKMDEVPSEAVVIVDEQDHLTASGRGAN